MADELEELEAMVAEVDLDEASTSSSETSSALPARAPFDLSSHLSSVLSCPVASSPSLSSELDLYLSSLVSSSVSSASSLVSASAAARDAVEAALRSGLRARSDDVQVQIYGSSLSELATAGSDIDLSLDWAGIESRRPPPSALPVSSRFRSKDEFTKFQRKQVYKLCDILSRDNSNFSNFEVVAFARVPVIKFNYRAPALPRAGVPGVGQSMGGAAAASPAFYNVDLCLHNVVAVRNSGLLGEYARVDGRARGLMMLVKRWVKAKGIGDASAGTPSSYCWMILAIYYLQVVGLLPNLQDKELFPDVAPLLVDGFDVSFGTAAELGAMDPPRWTPSPASEAFTLPVLFRGFVRFYALDFDTRSSCASIKRGGGPSIPSVPSYASLRGAPAPQLLKSAFSKTKPWRLCVEDPFETHDSPRPHDLGIVLSVAGFKNFERALGEAQRRTAEPANDIKVWEDLFVPSATGGGRGAKEGGAKKGGRRGKGEAKPAAKPPAQQPQQHQQHQQQQQHQQPPATPPPQLQQQQQQRRRIEDELKAPDPAKIEAALKAGRAIMEQAEAERQRKAALGGGAAGKSAEPMAAKQSNRNVKAAERQAQRPVPQQQKDLVGAELPAAPEQAAEKRKPPQPPREREQKKAVASKQRVVAPEVLAAEAGPKVEGAGEEAAPPQNGNEQEAEGVKGKKKMRGDKTATENRKERRMRSLLRADPGGSAGAEAAATKDGAAKMETLK